MRQETVLWEGGSRVSKRVVSVVDHVEGSDRWAGNLVRISFEYLMGFHLAIHLNHGLLWVFNMLQERIRSEIDSFCCITVWDNSYKALRLWKVVKVLRSQIV